MCASHYIFAAIGCVPCSSSAGVHGHINFSLCIFCWCCGWCCCLLCVPAIPIHARRRGRLLHIASVLLATELLLCFYCYKKEQLLLQLLLLLFLLAITWRTVRLPAREEQARGNSTQATTTGVLLLQVCCNKMFVVAAEELHSFGLVEL